MNTDNPLILLVEDNTDHAEIFIRSMKKNMVQCTIKLVNDGEQALKFLFGENIEIEKTPEMTPDLILLDLRLPKIDGLEVLDTIKKSKYLENIPVVVLTSSHSENDITKAYNLKANSYVVKPLDYPKFVEMVNHIGGFWLKFNTSPQKKS